MVSRFAADATALGTRTNTERRRRRPSVPQARIGAVLLWSSGEIAVRGSGTGRHGHRRAARMRRSGSMQASSYGRLIRARRSVCRGAPVKRGWDLRAAVPNHCLQPTGANRAVGPVGMPDISVGRA